MFSFFGKKNPWTSPGAMESWLKQLPTGDPAQAQIAIVDLLNDYLKSDDSLHLDYLPAIWLLSESIESILQQLLQHYLNNHKTSLNIEKVIWDSLFEVSQRFAQAYEPILEFEANKLLKILKPEGLARSLSYYLHYKSLQAKIRLFRFERWIPAQWVLIHKSFMLAELANVHTLPVALFKAEDQQNSSSGTTIELKYTHLLLLQLLNVGSFEPAHIERASIWLTMCATHLKVERTVNAEGFAVDLNSTEGLVRVSKIASEVLTSTKHSLRFINTYSITQILEQELEATRAQILEVRDPTPLQNSLILLEKWYGLWNHNNHVWARKGDREKAEDSQVWLIEDWQAMCNAAPPIPGSESQVPPPVPIYTIADQCRVLDRSSSGYGLIVLLNESRPFKLGMLLLVHEEDSNQWCLTILRRLKKLNLDQAEIGIEIIGRYITSMRPTIPKKPQVFQGLDGYEIDVVDESEPDYVPTLYIKPQEGTKAGNQPSLVMSKRHYHTAGQTFHLKLDIGPFTLTLGIPIEEGSDWVWCNFNAAQDPTPP